MRLSLSVSAEEVVSKLEDLIFRKILQYRKTFLYEEDEIKKAVQLLISAIEKHVKLGNTAYLGYAKIFSDFPLRTDSEEEKSSFVPCAVFEIYWSRVDLKDLITCLGIMGNTDYRELALNPKYRFFINVKISEVGFYGSPPPRPTIWRLSGLSIESDTLWKILRNIEHSRFGTHPATDTILTEKKLGRINYSSDRIFYPKFNKTIFGLKKFRETILNLFGEKTYTDRQIWYLFSKTDIIKVNRNVPMLMLASKGFYFWKYILSPKKILLIIDDPDRRDIKKFFSSFPSWSHSFFVKKVLPVLAISNKAKILEKLEDIL